jgi:GT2 family glycosyltransferase
VNEKREAIVDIVMLVHDRADWADLAIRAVESHTKNPARIIVVDMASVEPKTHALFAEVEARGHTVLHLAENRSFSHGVNAGADLGTSKYIVVLNDDAIVTEGWDGALLTDASRREIGLCGARSNFAAGAQGDPSFIGDPPFLVFVCVCCRRAVWEQLHGMDEETFDGFSSEDLDFSWRVLKAGLKLKVSNAFVMHAGSQTLIAQLGPSAAARAANNQKYGLLLEQKWGKEWVAAHSKLKQNVLVCAYSAEEWSRGDFFSALLTLKQAPGVGFSFHRMSRNPIHIARNLIADYALDKGFDWLVQLDDDATFPPDLLRRLLAHDKDVVTALAYQRKIPHLPCIYTVGEDSLMGAPCQDWEHTGLRKVDVSGFHCSAMKTSVIARLRKGRAAAEGVTAVPGTREYYGGFEKMGEDFCFSTNCRRLGIPIYCDTELISGHLGTSTEVNEEYVRRFRAGTAPGLDH